VEYEVKMEEVGEMEEEIGEEVVKEEVEANVMCFDVGA